MFVVFAGGFGWPGRFGTLLRNREGAGKVGIGEGRDAGPAEAVRRSRRQVGRRGSCERDQKQPSVSSKRTGRWGEKNERFNKTLNERKCFSCVGSRRAEAEVLGRWLWCTATPKRVAQNLILAYLHTQAGSQAHIA
jgi:hypothetical protein